MNIYQTDAKLRYYTCDNPPPGLTACPAFDFPEDIVPTTLVPPGQAGQQSLEVPITFYPIDDGVMSFVMGDLRIISNATNAPSLYYGVLGLGVEGPCSPFADCDGTCIDTTSDVDNCGLCDNICSTAPDNATPVCEGGYCDFICDTGYERVDDTCICPFPSTICDDECIDTRVDVDNCGFCGRSCTPYVPVNAGPVCEGGYCDFICDTGYERVGNFCQTPVPPFLEDMIDALIEFFDDSRASGALVGNGPGKSGEHRADALGNKLDFAVILVINALLTDEDYYWSEACLQFDDSQKRCDGEFPPPDFVKGEATSELNTRILAIMELFEEVSDGRIQCPPPAGL